MLICRLENIAEQSKLKEKIQKGFKFLERKDLRELQPGRFEIEGTDIYALVMEYETIPFERLKFEAHKRYIDIHYVAAGKEAIGCIDYRKLIVTDEYNLEKDAIFGRPTPEEDTTWVILSEGDVAVFYPSDVHAPKGMVGVSALLKKIVVKVAVA